ncbi:MAG: NADH-quinone oxidoreductase subunit C [Desulfovibrionales bacterium]
MSDDTTRIAAKDLLGTMKSVKAQGYRFVGITARDTGERMELLYHLDLDFALHTYRVDVPYALAVPSVTSIYFCALVYENEIKDQFGLEFEGLALDFEGRYLMDREVTSFPLRHPKTIPAKGGE